MTAFRRARFNFALDRAVDLARQLRRPLVIFEPLRIGYEWASDRLHAFVIEGMLDNAKAFARAPVTYLPYVEPSADADKGLLQALSKRACVIVADDWPCFFLPRMLRSAAAKVDVRMEAVDSNGLLPLRATERVFPTAFSFRVFLQKELRSFLEELPKENPLRGVRLPRLKSLPRELAKWKSAPIEPDAVGELEIDHSVPKAGARGGTREARKKLDAFISQRLRRYPEDRNHPDLAGTSELSPYLHFGHISAHEIFHAIAKKERWSPGRLERAGGKKQGYWRMSEAAEAFLDQLVTWRELAFNMTSKRDDYASDESLPGWARASLKKHAGDERRLYSVEKLEGARTHDELWNAAQRQMVRDGWFHNYLRMLWGKKILEWSETPAAALRTMEKLMNKYSLDGRDPCSYAGYAWVLGRYDRPWGPERKIFGTVRYMSSENTARKLKVKKFLQKYGA